MSATTHDPEIGLYLNGDGTDWLAQVELEQIVKDREQDEPDAFAIFFYVGTTEYTQTVKAYSHDHALEVFCKENKDGENPEAVRLCDEERNY